MLQVQSLGARRGSRFVFRDVSFTLQAGDVFLVKGANGSGKSTLLRVLAGLILPTEGQVLWDPSPAPPRHYIGHLDAVKPELTGNETLSYWRALYPTGTVQPFNDMFGVAGFVDKMIRFLSAGQKRRLTLSRLGLYDAPIWLMDEPTTALDHDAQNLLLQALATHRTKGGIAVIATHHDIDIPHAATLNLSPTHGCIA